MNIKSNKLIYYLSILGILLSVLIILFSLLSIKHSSNSIERSLSEWNNSVSKINISKSSSKPQIRYREDVAEGSIIGKLIINDKEIAVLTGTEDSLLQKGALHYSKTPMPGFLGNSIILAHREGVFRELRGLRNGNIVLYKSTYFECELVVFNSIIVEPDDKSIFESLNEPTVMLYTCYPFTVGGPSPQRYAVICKVKNVKIPK